MKRLLFTLLLFLFFLNLSHGQANSRFGVKGGLNLTFFKVVEGNFGPSVATETGYYGGAFVDFHVNDAFSFQPEVLYISLGDFNFINAPLYAKYEMAHNLDILLGPSMNYFFDFFSNKFKIRGDVSSAYHITEALDVHIKYTLGFQEISPNGLFFGVGVRF